MNLFTPRLRHSKAWWENYVDERETRRSRALLREIGWMLVEAVFITALLANFR